MSDRVFDFKCSCGAAGKLTIDVGERTPFACPEGCGASYVEWNDNGTWRLQCVVQPHMSDKPDWQAFLNLIDRWDDDGEGEMWEAMDQCHRIAPLAVRRVLRLEATLEKIHRLLDSRITWVHELAEEALRGD